MEQTKLASLRRYYDISQKEMGKLLNISEAAYRNKEKGTSQFKVSEMFVIANYFDKSVEEIFLPPDFIKREVLQKQ